MNNVQEKAFHTKGIKITQVVGIDDKIAITEKKFVKFNMEDVDKYRIYFEEVKNRGIFYPNIEFDDDVWVGMYEDINNHLNFKEYEYNKTIYLSLKFFVLIQLHFKKNTLIHVFLNLSEVKYSIKMTHNFNQKYLPVFIDYLESETALQVVKVKQYLTPYLQFIDNVDTEEYLIELSFIQWERCDTPRKLPGYESIIRFDAIIDQFLNTSDNALLLKFYPIILWWRITSVIPLRPKEFVGLVGNSCYQKEDNNYYLRVSRSKLRPHVLNGYAVTEVIDELKTTKEIFELINYFKEKLNLHNELYLFSHKAFLNISHEKHDLQSRINPHKVRQKDFRDLLEGFYQDVVFNTYGYIPIKKEGFNLTEKAEHCIEMLQPGDTRHLAFCSMMLQGFNPLTIAQMGGHKSLYSQNHYLNHIEEFCDAQTLMLVNSLKSNLKNMERSINNVLFSRDKRNLAFRIFDTEIKPIKVEEGYCYCANFPNECAESDCIFCKYFKIDFSKLDDNSIKVLNEKVDKVKKEVEVKIDFLRKIYTDMCKNTRNYEVRYDSNNFRMPDLERESARMQDLLKRTAILTAYIDVAKENE